MRYCSQKMITDICCHSSLTSPGRRTTLNPIEKAGIWGLGGVHGAPESWELVARPRINEVADGRPSTERQMLPLLHLTNLGQLAAYLKTVFKLCGALLFRMWSRDQVHGHHLERARNKGSQNPPETS